jgi:pre-mRNA-splicing factor CDC5/CEF1
MLNCKGVFVLYKNGFFLSLLQADAMIREEANFLRVAMGHENEPFEEFMRARDACQDDLIFFPGTSSYSLASVASNSEKLAAVQNEFEIVRRRLDEETKKATKLEQKIKVLTHGYQVLQSFII